jgi:hypothetical protein
MERDSVRLWMRTQREHDNVLPGWRGSMMVSYCRPGCKGSKTTTTYSLEVERERDGVRSSTQIQREEDNILPAGREGAG